MPQPIPRAMAPMGVYATSSTRRHEPRSACRVHLQYGSSFATEDERDRLPTPSTTWRLALVGSYSRLASLELATTQERAGLSPCFRPGPHRHTVIRALSNDTRLS